MAIRDRARTLTQYIDGFGKTGKKYVNPDSNPYAVHFSHDYLINFSRCRVPTYVLAKYHYCINNEKH